MQQSHPSTKESFRKQALKSESIRNAFMETNTINKEQMHDVNDLQEKTGSDVPFPASCFAIKRHCEQDAIAVQS
jgi:hypothetical protein